MEEVKEQDSEDEDGQSARSGAGHYETAESKQEEEGG